MKATTMLVLTLLQAEADSQKRNPALEQLAPNTWLHLKTARNPVGRSYSGVGGAIGGGTLMYFGGGHGSHQGNDVELYEIATNRWIQATEEEPIAPGAEGLKGGWGVGVLTAKGRPHTEHTYQQICYDPEGKRFLCVLTPGTWAFDPAKREWQALAGKHAPDPKPSPHAETGGILTLYDPVLKKVVCLTGGSKKGVHLFDPKTLTWERKGNPPIPLSFELFGTYVPEKRAFLINAYAASGKPERLGWFDATTLEWKDVASRPAELGALSSFACDPENKIVLCAVGGQGKAVLLWAFHPLQDTWVKVEARGEPPTGMTRWNPLNYDPAHRCFLFVNVLNVGGGYKGGRTDGVFAFKFGKSK